MVTELSAGVFMETIHCTLGFSFDRNFSWFSIWCRNTLLEGTVKIGIIILWIKHWKIDTHMCTFYIFSSSPHMIFVEFSKKNQKLKGFERVISCGTRAHLNHSPSQGWQTGSLKYITSFCGDRGNLMYIETILFHTVEPNTNVLFFSWP